MKTNQNLKSTEEIILENIEYHNKYGELYKENIQLLSDFQKLQEENEDLTNRLWTIWNSKSWKISKPFRMIEGKLTREKTVTSQVKQDMPKRKQKRILPEKLLKQLLAYDVISFDIFDTLILRNVNCPTDLFQLVGDQVGIENFKTYRMEINIFDIYKVLSKYIKMDQEKIMKVEFEVEKEFCMANPYFLQIFEELKQKKKKIIIVSDMYWPKEYLMKLLEHCGYHSYTELFVSCEYEENKGSGQLQKIAVQKIGKKYTYIHIGDNYLSDIEGSKKNGWGTYYYPKCSSMSNYKTIKNSVTSSINKAIVDNYFYHAIDSYDSFFKYGFQYGGFLVCGFCEWLNTFAKQNNIDKFLFLARDMKVVHQVYQKFYNQVENEYLVISRSAALELNFDEMPEEFIEFYFKPRMNSNENLKSMLVDSDLAFLVEKLESHHLSALDRLTDENYDQFRNFIYDYQDEICTYFESSKIAAQKYLKEKIGKGKNIAVIDLGWSGQILIQLRHFIKHNIHQDINVVGAYMANSNSNKVNHYIESGIMTSYLFSYAHNNDFLLDTTTIAGNTKAMLLEAMFSSSEGTLLKYELGADNSYQFLYGNPSANQEGIEKLMEGIVAFAQIYHTLTKNSRSLKISSVDAYMPFHIISSNYPYNYSIFKDTKEYLDSLPRFCGKRNLTTIGKIMKNRKLL